MQEVKLFKKGAKTFPLLYKSPIPFLFWAKNEISYI